MAKRSKAKKSQSSYPDKLKAEKEEKLSFWQVVKDERTRKIAGAFFLLLSAFLFVAFTSFLFDWYADQDKVSHGISIFSPASKTDNLLGNLGAYASYQFFRNGFGVASYLFCSFFFIAGVNWLFAKKIFSVFRNLRYVIVGVLYFSTAFSFAAKGNSFFWGGAVGDMISDWLTKILGWVGTAALLLVGGLAYIIWRFNPAFKMPSLPERKKQPIISGSDPDGGGPKLFIEKSAG
ncbi:MAG TPA: DNA translocase FtsK 4TM domain-containing protein, partial [Puia sp.]|nr:DNA translocase FtsK 4TM domain-containing protein [Puia sp.]